MIKEIQSASANLATLFENREYGKALRDIMLLTDKANQFVDQEKPWELAKQEGQDTNLHRVCSEALNMFRLLTLYLKPVLPKLAMQVEAFLRIEALRWQDADALLPEGHAINPYQHMMTRVDPKQTEALVEANKQNLQSAPMAEQHSPTRHAEKQ